LDLSRTNSGSLKTSGVDFAADYSLDTPFGRFASSVSATWVKDHETVFFPGQRTAERVGVADRAGTIPRWRTTASLGWSLRGLQLTTTVRHTPHYWDTNELGQVITRRVRSQTLIDAQASLELGAVLGDHSDWSGLTATIGVINLFDQEPGFSEMSWDLGYDPAQGDLRQRFGYIKLTKHF
jgi:outer membrane receptor protein involved in Fe transport